VTEDVIALHPTVPEPFGDTELDKIELAIIGWLVMHTEHHEGEHRPSAPLQLALGAAQARQILVCERGWRGANEHYASYVTTLSTVIGRLSERQRAKLRHPTLGRDSAQRILQGESL
jgi:hypothetical protein